MSDTTNGTEIHGQADDGYGAVADAFAANFAERGELGAAFCLYVDGVERVNGPNYVADRGTITVLRGDEVVAVLHCEIDFAQRVVATGEGEGQTIPRLGEGGTSGCRPQMPARSFERRAAMPRSSISHDHESPR